MAYLVDAHRRLIEQAACLSYFQHIEICHRGLAGTSAESRRKIRRGDSGVVRYRSECECPLNIFGHEMKCRIDRVDCRNRSRTNRPAILAYKPQRSQIVMKQRCAEPEVFDGKTGRQRVENLLKEIDASMDA